MTLSQSHKSQILGMRLQWKLPNRTWLRTPVLTPLALSPIHTQIHQAPLLLTAQRWQWGGGSKFHLLDHWKPSECSLTTIHWIHESSLPVPKLIKSFVGLAWCSVEAVCLSFLHRDGEPLKEGSLPDLLPGPESSMGSAL